MEPITYEEYLAHFGVKGMKWGVRKESYNSQKDRINSQDRVIKSGTVIQNISQRQLNTTDKRSSRMYAAYTSYDKASYIDMMAGFQYDGKGYKNEFLVKKDLKIPSDKATVKAFAETAKKNPQKVAKEMAAAYNATHILARTTPRAMSKKLRDLDNPESKRTIKTSKMFVDSLVSTKMPSTSENFYSNLTKKGYSALSDSNDRSGKTGTQDPLIIFNTKSVSHKATVKLTKSDIEYYMNETSSKSFRKSKNDLSEVQR